VRDIPESGKCFSCKTEVTDECYCLGCKEFICTDKVCMKLHHALAQLLGVVWELRNSDE